MIMKLIFSFIALSFLLLSLFIFIKRKRNYFLKNLNYSKEGKNIAISRSEYTTQNSPFFLNYEYFNIARGRNHEGYYIDHQGNILKYRKPEKWNYFYNSDKFSSDTFWGYELDGKISSKDLFQNLNNCSIGIVESQLNKINLEEIIQNLNESGYDKTIGGCDMGIRSYSILVYDNLNDQYKRIVLKTYGDISLTNKSVHTSKLLRYFD